MAGLQTVGPEGAIPLQAPCRITAGTFDTSGVPGICSSEPRRADPLVHGEWFAEPDLAPGTYTSPLHDPVPGFDVIDVSCDDADSATLSAGDATTRSAIINFDRGEHVTCTFTVAQWGTAEVLGDDDASGRAVLVPVEGRWRAENVAGRIDCGSFSRRIEPSPTEFAEVAVRRRGDRLVLKRLLLDGSNTKHRQSRPRRRLRSLRRCPPIASRALPASTRKGAGIASPCSSGYGATASVPGVVGARMARRSPFVEHPSR